MSFLVPLPLFGVGYKNFPVSKNDLHHHRRFKIPLRRLSFRNFQNNYLWHISANVPILFFSIFHKQTKNACEKQKKINKTQFIYLCTPVTINPLLTKCFSNNNHYTIFKGSLYKYITENVCVVLRFLGIIDLLFCTFISKY